MLFTKFGDRTVKVMSFGCSHLARLWESAWAEGGGDSAIGDTAASGQPDLVGIYNKHNFVESFLLTEIGANLAGRSGAGAGPVHSRADRGSERHTVESDSLTIRDQKRQRHDAREGTELIRVPEDRRPHPYGWRLGTGGDRGRRRCRRGCAGYWDAR